MYKMSNKMTEQNNKMYEGELDDIIIPIPENTVEINIEVTVYENGETTKARQIFNLKDIEEAKQLFWDCAMGEYPRYVFTEKGKDFTNW